MVRTFCGRPTQGCKREDFILKRHFGTSLNESHTFRNDLTKSSVGDQAIREILPIDTWDQQFQMLNILNTSFSEMHISLALQLVYCFDELLKCNF